MRRYLNIALAYAIASAAGGVFYREFTKWNGFVGVTSLGKVHVHLFLLGMMVFLLVALFSTRGDLAGQRTFRAFMATYNVGVALMSVMLVVRGVPQVLGITLSAGANGAISGMAGVSHILVGVGIVLLVVALRANERDIETQAS